VDIWRVVAVVVGGRYSGHPVFRRGAALEKIKIGRSGGNNSVGLVVRGVDFGRVEGFPDFLVNNEVFC